MSRDSPAWILLALAFASVARADGMFVWRNEQIDIREPDQKALIVYDQGVEDLVLSVKFEGAPAEFGWIVPLPSVPEMFPEEIKLFEGLSLATQFRHVGRSGRARELFRTGMERIEVVRTATVGPYDATILRADDGGSLRRWLKSHGFRASRKASRILERYTKDGWAFAALRLRPEVADSSYARQLASGTIQPIRFRFECPEPVFPLRISAANPDGSVVLLYVLDREALVPRGPADRWKSHVYGETDTREASGGYARRPSAAPFLPPAGEPFVLTKHLATLWPAQMEDVYFSPYDPAAALTSHDAATREEAATFIGSWRLARYESGLLERLTGPEAYTALWALGQIGDAGAEEALLRSTQSDDLQFRLEAVEGLATMRSRAALPLFVQGVVRPPAYEGTEWPDHVLQRACFDHLVEYGDSTCVPPLRKIASSDSGFARWGKLCADSVPFFLAEKQTGVPWGPSNYGNPSGILAVAALAACGDNSAATKIADVIAAEGARVTQKDALRARADQRNGTRGFPCGFWTGYATLRGGDLWCTLHWARGLLRSDSLKADAIYRRASADPRLPDAGRVVLLGNIAALTDGDLAELRAIWDRALRDPLVLEIADVEEDPPWGPDSLTVRLNINACCVAYALARHEKVDELLRLLAEVPAGDLELRGEVVSALAETKDLRARGVLWDYLRDVWDRHARTPEAEASMQCAAARYRRTPIGPLILPHGVFDRAWRERSIGEGLFVGAPPDTAFLRQAITDRSWAPYLRLRFLQNPGSGKPLLPVARRELEDLLRTETGATFQECAAQVANSLERIAARQAKEDSK